MSKIAAWLKPDRAKVKYSCDKPENWDSMDGDQKLEYFEQHMKFAGEKHISDDFDCDWWEGVDPNVDFDEEP